MQARFRALPQRQRGSFYSTAIIVAMFGIFLTAALKIAPAYMDDNVVANTMEGIAANNDLAAMSVGEIRESLMRTLNINNVEFDAGAVNVVREGSKEFVDIDYERRIRLFYNISAVVSFQHRFEKN